MAERARHENDELLLVTLLRQGNELAFQRIYNAYWEKLFQYTYNRLHVRETSEEVVQDVFLSLWAKRDSIEITASLSAYLYTATKHRLLNEVRSVKTRKAYAADYALFMKDLRDNSNDEQQAANELEAVIKRRVSELPKQCQKVYRLSREEHIPNLNIAEKLNISTKTVENYLTQALKYIRTSLRLFIVFIVLMA